MSTSRRNSRREQPGHSDAAINFLSTISLGGENRPTEENRTKRPIGTSVLTRQIRQLEERQGEETGKYKIENDFGSEDDELTPRDVSKSFTLHPSDISGTGTPEQPLTDGSRSGSRTPSSQDAPDTPRPSRMDSARPPTRVRSQRNLSIYDVAATNFLANIALDGPKASKNTSAYSPMSKPSSEKKTPSLKDGDSARRLLVGSQPIPITSSFFLPPIAISPTLKNNSSGLPISNNSTFSSLPSSQMNQQNAKPIIYIAGQSTRHELNEALRRHSVLLTTGGGTPIGMFSIFKYYDEKIRQAKERRKSRFNKEFYIQQIPNLDSLKRKKAESYAHLLHSTHSLGPLLENEEITYTFGSVPPYDPYFLDDPALKTGKHRTVIALPSFMGSIIQYIKPNDLKRELNDHFRQTHPGIDPTITLSKIRKVKQDMVDVAIELDLELSSVAKGWVYWEKIIGKGLVNKSNRKLIAACCLFLAVKVNEPKTGHYGKVLQSIEKHLGVSAKEVREHEWATFTFLDFNLYLPRREFMPHFDRILVGLDYNNVQEYLGDSIFYIDGDM